MDTIPLTEETVKWIGRTHFYQDILWLVMSGSGIAFCFTGSELALTLCGREASQRKHNEENYARIAVYVDGKRILDDVLDLPEKTYRIESPSPASPVTVQLIKLSECAMSMCGIKALSADTADISPAPDKPHKLEIIGDSITCGYGIDDENCEHHFSTATEDVTKAYSYKTAQRLNADYSMFSTSGHGIISGYTDDPAIQHTDQQIPARYLSLGLCFDTFDGTLKTTDVAWDFSRFQPDAIVINLGTNDDSYCLDDADRQLQYQTAYTAFLKLVRRHNPAAHIFCVLGLMGSRLYPAICKACEAYTKETGDDNLSTLKLPEQDGAIGYVADYHPLERFHDAAVDVLVPAIASVMNWEI